MGKYLKMADVFPVEIKTDDESGSLICDEDGIILESFAGDKVADYTLHAISSHDELVAEVELLREALQDLMDWTLKNSTAYDCRPYNAARRLLNK